MKVYHLDITKEFKKWNDQEAENRKTRHHWFQMLQSKASHLKKDYENMISSWSNAKIKGEPFFAYEKEHATF